MKFHKYVNLTPTKKLSLKTKPPGENIFKLARKRRLCTIRHYTFAAIILMSALILFFIIGTFPINMLFLLGGVVSSYYLYRNGQYLMKQAGNAKRGALAESQVAALLTLLIGQGWQIEYNLRIQKWGDADVVLRSPKDNWYVIDVKSHAGTKIYQYGRLQKRYGKNIYDFKEGDLISKVKGQAKEVKSLKSASWVTPILCFTQGNVEITNNEARGVYVVTVINLISILLQLDR